ncbi:putative NAD(P)/FAD-binding protein YdhS [Crossiella equi]|uniref:NAD(P)/FAD-binding protein YdhS n=1 Tax=Crossiella equi TaxID=130796 RepID=A0ABS5AMH3_9PSEU|nr:FAD/NAD(P)-binding protein [Crossiella equi]MBP2477761.1 putative NAD(P)/FAD-binding protein YdhS [Crossiella equi]
MLKLAVVGGGPAAACVLEAVARHTASVSPVSVTVFEPGPNLWRGRVFQPEGDEVLANVPMAEMSVRAWDPGHGTRWLREHGRGELAAETAVPPRWLVGRYLEDSAARAIDALRAAGSQVVVRPWAVRSLTVRGGRLEAQGDGWIEGPFDHAVLCLGGAPSYDHYALTGVPGFVPGPYPLRRSLAEVGEHASVGVVGSGLTAVDVVMALRARGHQGPIRLISRTGGLPAVRRKPVHRELTRLTVPGLVELAGPKGALRLEEVLALVRAELAEAGADFDRVAADLARTGPSLPRLREDLDSALHDEDPGWTVLRDAMVLSGQDAWYLLAEQDKARIRAHHRALMRNCCPMPPGNAAHLLELAENGQLEVLAGVRAITPKSGGGFTVSADGDVDVDVVVAASTPAEQLPAPTAAPLLASLTAQGMAVPHSFGGVHIDRTTSRLTTWRGVPCSRLYALGDLTRGSYLFTFGMPVLAARADRIAHTITRGLTGDNVLVGHGQGSADLPTA